MDVIWKVLQNFVLFYPMSLPMEMSIIDISPMHEITKVKSFSCILQTYAFFFRSGKEEKDKLLPNQNGVLGKQVLHWKAAKWGSQGTYIKS